MEHLVQHAMQNVWQSPRQDRQFISNAKRISRNGGEVVQFESDWLTVYLPDNKNYYHLYQIGGVHPDFLGLFPVKSTWVSLTEVSNKMGMIADMYSGKGVLCPKFESFYIVTKANNLILAIRKQERLLGIDYNNEDMFFRVYTNAYFQSARSHGLTEKVMTAGRIMASGNDILSMQNEVAAQRAKPVGFAWAVINGYYAEEVSPINCKVGDLVDWVYDSSISKVINFKIDYLKNFDSTLDSERKYLIHYPGNVNRIESQDDIEMFLVQRDALRANGLYHHKNTAAALRMLTHRDYSVSVRLINAFVDGHPRWTDPQNMHLLMLIREGGFDRPLVFEKNRIHELYKLKDADIVPAMIEENSSVPSFAAAVLEAAAYPEIMRAKEPEDITLDLVKKAYGYNAMSKILGDTPKRPIIKNGLRVVPLGRQLYKNSTGYEYDGNGVLLGWYYHTEGYEYTVTNPNCASVEMISGSVGQALDETYGQNTQTLDPNRSYRMYMAQAVGGVPRGPWKDVTDQGQYVILRNQLTWLVDPANYLTMVRSDKINLGYVLSKTIVDGLIEFDIGKVITQGGVTGLGKIDVPMGEMDIFLNGRSLIPEIDYVFNFPKILIFNKKYLVDPKNQAQQIVIRSSGFPDKDLKMNTMDDVGFVKWDLMSKNGIFNLRDDRVMRIVVDGRSYPHDIYRFAESHLPSTATSTNGLPYGIRDIVVPMREYAKDDAYTLRDVARQIDQQVSDYMTPRMPEPPPTVPNVVEALYPVYTPFLCKILYDLITGVIGIEQLKNQYNDDLVRKVCQPYEWILAFDPTQTTHAYNPDFVIVHPHFHNTVMDIDIYHYAFLKRVVNIYMKDKVELSHWLRLKTIN